MKEILVAGAIAALATFVITSPSTAASLSEDVALCASALNDKGIAAADAFRPKFLKFRGAAVRKVTVLMIPTGDGAQSIEAECAIKKGEVVDVTVKS